GVLQQILDNARFLRAHQVEDGCRQVLRQVIDQGSGIVGGNVLRELGDFFRGTSRQQNGARFRAELRDRLHRQAAVPIGKHREGCLTLLVLELAEYLGKVGRVLLLKQIEQVGGRTNTQQSPDRIEYEINSALRGHVRFLSNHKTPHLPCCRGIESASARSFSTVFQFRPVPRVPRCFSINALVRRER